MQGAITNIESLEKWFKSNNLPYFSLKYAGQGEKIIFRNEVWDDITEAWEHLRDQVQAQADGGRAMLELLVYNKGKANHPLRTNLDIRPTAMTPVAGIGSTPGVYGGMESYISQRIELEMLRRDNEELQAQINNPINSWERILDRVAQSPQLAGIAQVLIAGLFSKGQAPVMAQSIAGTPGSAPGTDADDESDGYEHLEAAAEKLGTDPATLAKKVNELVNQNPDLAKSLL